MTRYLLPAKSILWAAIRCESIPALVSVLTIGWVVFIWSYRFIPMEDYPLWLSAAKVFSQFIQGPAPPFYRLVAWPVPNSAFVGIVGLLDLALNSEVSGKIFLTLCTVLYVVGAYLLIGSLTAQRNSALMLLPLLLVFHRCMWAGELSFSLGLAILLIVMAVALRASRLPPLVVLVVSVALFYSHAICYFSWLIFLGALCVFDSPRFPRLKTLIAVSPSLVLLVIYAMQREHPHGPRSELSLISALREAPRFWSLFSPLHFFEPFYVNDPQWIHVAALLFNISFVTLVLSLIALWLWKVVPGIRQENGRVKAVLVSAVAFFVVFAVVPFNVFTGVFDFNYRFLLPAFLLVLASLAPVVPSRLRDIRILASAALAVLVFHFWYIARISGELTTIFRDMSQANLGASFWDVTHNEFELAAPIVATRHRLLPVHQSLMYFADYVRIEHDWPSRMFVTSFVRSTRIYPALLGRSELRSPPPCSIVILGIQTQNRNVARMLSDVYHLSSETKYMLIMHVNSVVGGPAGCT